MASQAQERTKVFISYSRADQKYLKRLRKLLRLHRLKNPIDVWADDRIRPGMKWREEIERALGAARVAVLLVSPDFLASDFIDKVELPALLDSAHKGGTEIFIVFLGTVLPAVEGLPLPPALESLRQFQAVNNPRRPIEGMKPGEQDAVWVTVSSLVHAALVRRQPATPTPGPRLWPAGGDCHDYASVFEIYTERARGTVPLFYAAVVAAPLVGLALILSAWLVPDFRQNAPVSASMLAFGGAACVLSFFFMKKVVDEYADIKSCEFMRQRFDGCEKWEADELRDNIRFAEELIERMLKS
jgi:hypothetical protein